MIRIYEIETPAQFDLLADELYATLPSMASEFEGDKTVEEAWIDLKKYLEQRPHAGIWVALDDGALTAWSAAKVYVDLPNTITAAVTWAWARAGARNAPSLLHHTMIAWARERQVIALYAARKTRLDAYARWVGRHGYLYDRVVFVHRLSAAAAPAREEVPHELRRARVELRMAEGDVYPPGTPAPPDAVRSARTGTDRADGRTARDSDIDAPAASDLEPAKRRSKSSIRTRRRDGEQAVGREHVNGTKREWNGRRWIQSGVVRRRRTGGAARPPES
jgi:hypothetical protein